MAHFLKRTASTARRTFSAAAAAVVESLEMRRLLSTTPALGVNIRRLGFDSQDKLFADAMKEPNAWSNDLASPNDVSSPAPIDASGWPTTDAGIEIVNNATDEGGTYALTFTGQAVVAPIPSEPLVQVANQAYDPVANVTTAQVIVPAGQKELMLDFTNTRRLPGDTTATGVTNVQLMRPSAPDASTSYAPGTLFTTPILNLIANFSAIRFMDYSLTNYNPQVNWSDRTVPSQVQTDGKGGAWEYAVALANQTGKDIWINIPEMATNDYIHNLADLIAYGSDGANPYTGPQGSAVSDANPNPVPDAGPVWAGLKSNLNVYLEYSNEVWNTSFGQYGQNLNAAVKEVNAGNSPLNFDGDGSEYDWAARRTAERTVDTSNIFRSVFGDSQMISRIRPVLQWQYGNLNNTAALGLQFLNNYYNNGDGLPHVASPEPASHYLYGGGGGWYGGLSNPLGTGDVTVPGATFSAPSLTGYRQDPTGSTWTFAGAAGIAANGSALGNPASTSGTQAAYLQAGGRFSESVNFTGGLADLTFSAAAGATLSFTVAVDGKDVSTPWTLTGSYSAQRTAVFDSGAGAGAHTVTFTATGGSGSVFISNVVAETANGIYKSTIQDISSTTRNEAIWARAFGLHMVSYEGGFVFGTGIVGTPLQIAANQDPRAEQAAISQMNEFFASGGELGMYYDTTNHIWALTLDINNQNTPKIMAVQSVLSQPGPALNVGVVLPTTSGQSTTVYNSLAANTGAAGLYAMNATAPGVYHLVLNSSTGAGAFETFYLDGQLVGGFTSLTGSAANSAPSLTFTIATPGLHVLLLDVNGAISPGNPANAITVTAGAGATLPAVPAAPASASATAVGMTQVNVAWSASAGAQGYLVERTSDGVTFRQLTNTTGTSFVDSTAVPSTTYTYSIVAYNPGGFAAPQTASATTAANYVPGPWTDSDSGEPYIGGYANFAPSTSTWTVAGGGADIWNHSDAFNFLSQPLTGDGSIIARVASVGNSDPYAKSGVMFRGSNDGGDVFIDLEIEAGGGLTLQARTAPDTKAISYNIVGGLMAPRWLKLTRQGDTFTGYYSSDGVNWTAEGPAQTVVLPTTALAGLAVTAHNAAARSTSTFTNLAVSSASTPVPAKLAYTQPPAGAVAGSRMNSVSVAVEDASGNVVSSDTSYITLTLSSGTFDSGVNSVTIAAANGVAVFDTLQIDTAGAYTITATDGSLVGATSSSFTISPKPGAVSLSQSSVTVSPSSIAPGATSTLTLQTRDAQGNNLTTGGLSVAFSLAGSGTSGGSIGAVTDHGNGTYTAVFTGSSAGTARQIAATINGAAVTSTQPTITVASASPKADLSITLSGPTSASRGVAFNYTITVTNNGPSDSATGYVVTDTLPAGFVFQSSGSTGGATASGQKVTFTRAASLAAGQNRVYVIHVLPSSTLAHGAVLKDQAAVATRGTVDPVSSNNVSNIVSTKIA